MARDKYNPNAQSLINEYISSMSDANKQICHRLRELIHRLVPDVIEDWKWGPNFNYKGMLFGFAGFKDHVNFVFFQGALIDDKYQLFGGNLNNQRIRTIQFSDVNEIVESKLSEYIVEAAKNNLDGKKTEKTELTLPDDFKNLLIENNLLEKFLSKSYTYRKEFILWIESSKRTETRLNRLQQSVPKINAGIQFNEKINIKTVD